VIIFSFFFRIFVAATQEVPTAQRCFNIIQPRKHGTHGRCHTFGWPFAAFQEEFSLYQTLGWNTWRASYAAI